MTRNLIVSLLSNCLIMMMVYLKEVVHCDLYLQSSVITRFYLKCNEEKNDKILYYFVINNGNRSPIWSVIKRAINKIV